MRRDGRAGEHLSPRASGMSRYSAGARGPGPEGGEGIAVDGARWLAEGHRRPSARDRVVRSADPGRFPSSRFLALAVIFLLSGCTSPVDYVEDAERGGRSERWEALGELAFFAREGELRNLRDDERTRIDGYLRDRFPVEPNPSLRARILSIALDGPFPCGPDLLRASFADPGLAVRYEAVQRAASLPPAERRDALSGRLLDDSDPLVRIAAARAYRELGDASWARELVQVIVDGRAATDVRFHAYLSAIELTGADLMFLEEEWKAWLEEHGS